MLPVILAAGLAGCSNKTLVVGSAHPTPDSRRVLVVYNASSEDSREVAQYYASHRLIPSANIVRIDCPSDEEISEADFHKKIEEPVEANLRKNPNPVDFIVLTKGIPIRLSDDQHYSVDAWLAAGDLPIKPIVELTRDALINSVNPYFNAHEPFSSKKFGFHLVTRLDGYTVEDCKALVDHSLDAKPVKGPFLLDEADNRKTGNYLLIQRGLDRAAKVLSIKGFDVDLDQTKDFVAPADPVAGYASWGSNDAAFDLETYKKIRFKPGALCETFVSTSGRTFRPTRGGQSLIADLIADGVTGVKGYVSEPFTFALAKPEILFDRYTGGLNLAESFYAASEFLKWKDVVIGDPLCDPYRR